MNYPTQYPLLLFAISFIALWLSAWIGWWFRKRQGTLDAELREDFGFILAATLTLLGLIIGFSFSMATSRYDQRKNYEEAEANAIGTEYVRADLLPVRGCGNRTCAAAEIPRRASSVLHGWRWTRDRADQCPHCSIADRVMVRRPCAGQAQTTPMMALVVSGMNDVLNSQGYTQAGYWNRIPTAAWGLMAAIAIGCNLLVGYGSRSAKAGAKLLPILPLIVSIAFMLIADIDSPRHGIIRVRPQNLINLAESLPPPSRIP